LITNFYEIHFFRETKHILRPFVQSLSSARIKNSGGFEKLKTVEEKLAYCKFHNDKMDLPPNFQLTLDSVTSNPLKKSMYKDFSNAFFGKFSQHSKHKTTLVYSQHQLEAIAAKKEILDFSEIDNNLMVECEDFDLKPNLKTNLYIGAEITSQARVFTHDFLRLLQEQPGVKCYAVDTDCLMYSIPKNVPDPLPFSDALGDFKSMIPDNCEIVSYQSLGCRNYSFLYKDENNVLHSTIKVKGLSLKSAHLENPLSHEIYEDFIQSHFKKEIKSLTLGQIRLQSEKSKPGYKTKFQTFDFKNDLYMKRLILDENDCRFPTKPYGFKP
jgi:hypothetical protein